MRFWIHTLALAVVFSIVSYYGAYWLVGQAR